MSENCPLCNALTTKKAIITYNSCAKCYRENKIETISDEELNEQILKLVKIKNMREEKKSIIETYLEQGKSINEIFYNVESMEVLETLIRECDVYIDNYKSYILLNKLIQEENIVFATQLFVSKMINDIVCCEYCHTSSDYNTHENQYLWKLLNLCIKLGDIDRFKYLEYYYNIKLIEIHNDVPKYYNDWTTNEKLTKYENDKIRILIDKVNKITSKYSGNSWSQENIKDKFYQDLLNYVKPINNVNIIKLIFENYPSIFKSGIYIDDFIYKIIASKNKDMILWIKNFNVYIPHDGINYNGHLKNTIISQISKYQNEEMFNPNIDLDFYLYTVELSGCSKSDLILGGHIADNIENINYKFFELMFENTINYKYKNDNDGLRQRHTIENIGLPKIFYAAKLKRPDIYNYLLDKIH